MAVISLKHTTKHYPEQRYFFYEGSLVAYDGVITVPDGYDHWVQRLYKLGFVLDPKTNDYLSWTDVQGLMSDESTTTPEEPAAPVATTEPVVEAPVGAPVVTEAAPVESAKSEVTDEAQATAETTTEPAADTSPAEPVDNSDSAAPDGDSATQSESTDDSTLASPTV